MIFGARFYFGGSMIKIKFTNSFSSPVFGNVYIGKEVTLRPNEAAKYLNSGMAQEVKAEKPKEVKIEQPKKVKENGFSKSKRGKKSFKG